GNASQVTVKRMERRHSSTEKSSLLPWAQHIPSSNLPWLAGQSGNGNRSALPGAGGFPSSGRSVVLGVHTDGRPLMNHSSGRRPEQPSHPVSGPSVTQGRCPLVFSSPTETDEVIDPPHRSVLRV